MKRKIRILDTTLRDGLQGEEISYSVGDKLKIVKLLDEFGVSYIEAGNPYSNPANLAFFGEARRLKLKNARLCAFGSTRRRDRTCGNDENLAAILSVNTPVTVIFGKSWDLHVREVLGATPDENLSMIYDTVKFLKEHEREVIFDAEHFFDGYKENSAYAVSVIRTAIEAGADNICLCDTNGGTLPSLIYDVTKKMLETFPCAEFSIHTHNDCGCAVANTLMAIEAGVSSVQGTFLGIGERCGNADLSCIIPNILLKMGLRCDGILEKLYDTCAALYEITNIAPPTGKPYIGRSAFTHKAGMHIDGMIKNRETFEHINPKIVGNKTRYLISDAAGRGTVLQKIKNLAPGLTKDSDELLKIVQRLKELEYFGYQFEAADASFEILVKKILGTFVGHFQLVLYKTIGEFPAPNGEQPASAFIKVLVGDKTEMTAASGNGPVNALDLALRKALAVFYPTLSTMYLSDYKVRVLEQNCETSAKVRVLIESTDGITRWTTIGVSNDIIEASLIALVDSIEYKLGSEA